MNVDAASAASATTMDSSSLRFITSDFVCSVPVGCDALAIASISSFSIVCPLARHQPWEETPLGKLPVLVAGDGDCRINEVVFC